MSMIDVKKINKFDSDWDANLLFSGFNVRVTLKKSQDIITNIDQCARLRKRLVREMGEDDGSSWILQTNPKTQKTELYLINTGKIVLWKLQDNIKFNELFEIVEQHTDDPNEISKNE